MKLLKSNSTSESSSVKELPKFSVLHCVKRSRTQEHTLEGLDFIFFFIGTLNIYKIIFLIANGTDYFAANLQIYEWVHILKQALHIYAI